MFDDLDEALRQLLIREMPIKNNEIDIVFDQPKREWSARLSRPTVNLFLHEVFENKQLRQPPQWEVERKRDSSASLRRTPMRIDLNYLVTAWATEPDDEHRLLHRALLALLRYTTVPAELLPETLQDQPFPIPIHIAQKEHLPNTVDLWSVMDNEMKPALACMVTVSVNPSQVLTTPLVRTREVRIDPTASQVLTRRVLREPEKAMRAWSIGGQLKSAQPLPQAKVTLVERGLDVEVKPEGQFVIGHLQPGEYTLEVVIEGRKPSRHKLTVPSPDYEFEV